MDERVRELVDRLNSGERNCWLVYELCKGVRPTTVRDIMSLAPYADSETVVDGFREWNDARQRIA